MQQEWVKKSFLTAGFEFLTSASQSNLVLTAYNKIVGNVTIKMTDSKKVQAKLTSSFLVCALEGVSHACQFKPNDKSIRGRCINPVNSQTISVSSITEVHE
ncbi:MAG: hypothetical protein WBP13_06940 [Methylophilaceae bacterium]